MRDLIATFVGHLIALLLFAFLFNCAISNLTYLSSGHTFDYFFIFYVSESLIYNTYAKCKK